MITDKDAKEWQKMVEKLEKQSKKDKEKTKEAWKKIMDKEDGKFLDEMAVLGFDRKKRKTSD